MTEQEHAEQMRAFVLRSIVNHSPFRIERADYEAFKAMSPDQFQGTDLSLYNQAKHKITRAVERDLIEAC
jgi:hypothetical protein